MLKPIPILDRNTWNDMLRTLPYAHILQTWEWGEFKRATTGWKPTRLAFYQDGAVVAMASILTRTLGPLKVMYVPKGPALDYSDLSLVEAVLERLKHIAKRQFAIWIKIDPDVVIATGIPGEEDDITNHLGQDVVKHLEASGWRFSSDQIQFRNTICIDLEHPADDILAAMSQNTRRKVRTASKKGVTIRAASLTDMNTLYDLYRITGERDAFLTRPAEYYERAWHDFLEAGLAHALIAEVEGRAIAHVILFHFGKTCWYFYGASANEERQRMPNYALQWEAMQWAQDTGYTIYDMWGAPEQFNEADRMWGVYEFKRGFRGTVTRHVGAWDYAPYPLLYYSYVQLWPRLRNWLRRRRE